MDVSTRMNPSNPGGAKSRFPTDLALGGVHLNRLLSEVPWAGEADKANYMAALLTVVTMSMWTAGHPFLALSSNQSGLGKSVLAQLLCVVGRTEPVNLLH